MVRRILPEKVTNEFRGHGFTKWAFYLITAVTIGRSLIHVFLFDGGAGSIAGIPLGGYSTGAANAVVFVFGLWGLSQLLMALMYVIVAIRYKSLIPLMYCLLVLEYAARLILGFLRPLTTLHTAPGETGNYILTPLCLLLLVFSLMWPKTGKSSRE